MEGKDGDRGLGSVKKEYAVETDLTKVDSIV
jgi:hypothetical protein